MTCHEALDLLLEADVEALEGVGDTPLAAHVRSCPRCRRVASVLAREEEALDRALMERSRAAADGAEDVSDPERARTRRWRVWGAAGSLAAAAALAALLLLRSGEAPVPGPSAPEAALPETPAAGSLARAGSPGLAVEAPSDRTVAVFETSDPDITVIWFF